MVIPAKAGIQRRWASLEGVDSGPITSFYSGSYARVSPVSSTGQALRGNDGLGEPGWMWGKRGDGGDGRIRTAE